MAPSRRGLIEPGERTRKHEDLEREHSTSAAKADIEADNEAAESLAQKAMKKIQDRADSVVDKYIAVEAGKQSDLTNMQRGIERLARTPFGKQALLRACKAKGIDVNAYAEMLAISKRVGKKTRHPDALGSRRHVTGSLERLHGVNEKEDSEKQKPVVNIFISAPFKDVPNPRNTGYTVVNGESETPAECD